MASSFEVADGGAVIIPGIRRPLLLERWITTSGGFESHHSYLKRSTVAIASMEFVSR